MNKLEAIQAVLKTLTYREHKILELHYGIGDGYAYTLEEIGKIFKVTRERVRQVEAKAIRKLQHPMRARVLHAISLGFYDPDEFDVSAFLRGLKNDPQMAPGSAARIQTGSAGKGECRS